MDKQRFELSFQIMDQNQTVDGLVEEIVIFNTSGMELASEAGVQGQKVNHGVDQDRTQVFDEKHQSPGYLAPQILDVPLVDGVENMFLAHIVQITRPDRNVLIFFQISQPQPVGVDILITLGDLLQHRLVGQSVLCWNL